MALTQKQEAFVAKYLECNNATEAYRHAYNTKSMKNKTVNDTAYKLTIHPEIAQTIKKIRDKVVEELTIDRKYITQEVLDTIAAAKKDREHNAVLKGCEQLSKMYDLNEDKQNDRLFSSKDKQALLENFKQRMIDITPKEENVE